MRSSQKKAILFVLFTCAAVGMAYPPLRALLRTTEHPDYYSHIVLMPVVSAFFLFWKRKEIFVGPEPLFPPGLLAMAGGLALFLWGRARWAGPDDAVSIAAFAALVFGLGLPFHLRSGGPSEGLLSGRFLPFRRAASSGVNNQPSVLEKSSRRERISSLQRTRTVSAA